MSIEMKASKKFWKQFKKPIKKPIKKYVCYHCILKKLKEK